jgi:hypothetical protein
MTERTCSVLILAGHILVITVSHHWDFYLRFTPNPVYETCEDFLDSVRDPSTPDDRIPQSQKKSIPFDEPEYS